MPSDESDEPAETESDEPAAETEPDQPADESQLEDQEEIKERIAELDDADDEELTAEEIARQLGLDIDRD